MKFIEVIAPLAEEYAIDDFLGNSLQVRINGKWKYLTNIDLPPMNLKIIEVKKLEDKACLTIQIL